MSQTNGNGSKKNEEGLGLKLPVIFFNSSKNSCAHCGQKMPNLRQAVRPIKAPQVCTECNKTKSLPRKVNSTTSNSGRKVA
jgi:hypothetical protein